MRIDIRSIYLYDPRPYIILRWGCLNQVKYKEATKYRSAEGLPSASEGDRAYRQMISDSSAAHSAPIITPACIVTQARTRLQCTEIQNVTFLGVQAPSHLQ